MMERLLKKYVELKTREEGQTTVEYVLILAAIAAMVGAVSFTGLGADVQTAIEGIIP